YGLLLDLAASYHASEFDAVSASGVLKPHFGLFCYLHRRRQVLSSFCGSGPPPSATVLACSCGFGCVVV
ncbi:hypothetical protein L195_g060215, partial [Trifolium pratense]